VFHSHRRAKHASPLWLVGCAAVTLTVDLVAARTLLTEIVDVRPLLGGRAGALLLPIALVGVLRHRVATVSERIFSVAQAAVAPKPVRYASGANRIASRTAMRPTSGTIPTRPSVPVGLGENYSPRKGPTPYVSIGRPLVDALEITVSVTNVLGVETRAMEPILVLERRKSEAVTPYKWHAWEAALLRAGILDRYPDIVQGLREGFIVNFPIVTHTQIPPNRPSVSEFRSHFDSIVASEHGKGRYIGPFTRSALESAIGPFQCSPFSIIPKVGRVDKFRIIQNFSFPVSPSIAFPNFSVNSAISSSDFPSTWGTFEVTCLVISTLPPGSQIAVRDVSEAYRTVPLHYTQWPAGVAHVDEDTFFVDC
jgi:hypothetical protein